jgi:DNA-directed RNA polymerase specialized sigma24 family protein
MHNAEMNGKTIAEKARFLQGLGLEVSDAAEMLGTSTASVKELLRQAKNKAGKGEAKRNGDKSEKRKAK